MKRITALAAALLSLGGCGSNDKPPAGAPTDGCTVTATEELFVSQMYACESRSTRVYLFASSTARDDWRKAAEGNGAVVTGEGDKWLEVKA